MTDAEADATSASTERLRARIAAVIREDLAAERAAGFPLVWRFPNSELASVPDAFARLDDADQNRLLDALAHFSTLWWSHELVRDREAHPILGPYLHRRPKYPDVDWFGGRPKKAALKKAVMTMLAEAGYDRQKIEGAKGTEVVVYAHSDQTFPGRLLVHFDSALMRQMEFGFRDWLAPSHKAHFSSANPRAFMPIVGVLAYDHLWDGHGTNNPVCWDLITEANLDESIATMRKALERLTALGKRVNALTV
jgi:hypothetical protein